MATKPTPGGSDGTYGTELNAFLDVSLDVNGFIATEALQTDATAPVDDKAVANKKYVDDEHKIKGWAVFDGDVAVGAVTPDDSFNVTSINKDSEGTYTITWDTDFASANYVVLVTANTFHAISSSTRTAGACEVITYGSGHTVEDSSLVSVAGIGDQ